MRLHIAGMPIQKACDKAGIAKSEYYLLKHTEPFKEYWKELKALKTKEKGGISTDDIDAMAVKIVHCALAGKKYKGSDVSLTTFRMAMEWIKNSHRVDTSEQQVQSGGIDGLLKDAKARGIDLEGLSEDKLLELKDSYKEDKNDT